MYLSYSGYKKYHSCPRQYWYGYIQRLSIKQENQQGTLFGTAVGLAFEKFYVERLWRDPDPKARLAAEAERMVDEAIRRALRQGIITWSARAQFPSRDALIEGVREAIPRGLKAIAHHRLVGRQAEAEVKLDVVIQGHKVAGRADFIVRRISPYEDLCIIDGKGSRWRDQYVDATQVKWYCLQHKHLRGTLPDKAAFLFWQWDAAEAVDWVAVVPDEIAILEETILGTIAEIERASRVVADNAGNQKVLAEQFPARCGDRCKFCPYSSVCVEGVSVMDPKKVALPSGATGVCDIGLDGGEA